MKEAHSERCIAGQFSFDGSLTAAGELHLRGQASRLKLFSRSEPDWSAKRDVCGRLLDSTHVSLLNCVPMAGTGEHFRGDDHFFVGNLFPHYILIGHKHVTSEEERIASIHFSLDDATALFGDFRVFGQIFNAREHLAELSKTEGGKYVGELGALPHIFYFNGKLELLSTVTSLGVVSARYTLVVPSSSADGIHLDADVVLAIDFSTATTVRHALRAVLDLVRFVEIAAGRPQNVKNIKVELDGNDGVHQQQLDLIWPLGPRRDAEDEWEPTSWFDLPFWPSREPEKMSKVLAAWLARNEEWRTARLRYSTSFASQRRYDPDRLVGAANMFDLLPDNAFPPPDPTPDDLAEARDKARALFRSLPHGEDRSSVLGALGRIGKLSLKRKVRSRVRIIARQVGDLFPDLELVADHAVDCRNYYVHGTKPKLDYESGESPVTFFTNTLEFVFAVSDLIDAGWNSNECIRRYTTMSHPFGRYRVSYAEDLAELKALLPRGA
ncbi:HEPN domain-containing protein [Alicycliphilus denitrificans]|uniref:Uncharacterized protein n=1 Tax=Alicycliphilus denitrificans (strain DSM 14773 / CIP 107495 / K601) TaxID=596154 RepID=F4G6M3_ALIDK|nr:HEPN domain-containing protein [Alicycliphilus denitrificans]AEB85414.1 hypothetical protein Alide2_3068 [Alicycliphilus denitrificans K601]